MSPTWFSAVAAAIPASRARSVTSSSRCVSGDTSPTGTVVAESVNIPWYFTPTSSEMMSPSCSTRLREGIPWTISLLIDAQMLPGKPYSPLNAGVAPAWLRINSSASASSSAVVRPGRVSARSSSRLAARIRPPCAITSISRADLSWIMARLQFQRPECARRHLVHAPHRVDRHHLRAVARVPVEHRRRLPAEHLEARAHRVRLVVLAPHERAAVALRLRAGAAGLIPREGRLAHRAGRAPADALDDHVVGDVEDEHRVELPPQVVEHLLQSRRLRRRAHHAVQHRAARELGPRHGLLDDPEDHLVGDEVPAVHVRLRLEPEAGPVALRRAQHVARGEDGYAERRGEARRLGPLARSGLPEENDDHV